MQASHVKRKTATKEVTKPKETTEGNPVKEGPHTVKPSTTTPPKTTNETEILTDEKPAKIAQEEKNPVIKPGSEADKTSEDPKHLPGEDVPSGTLQPEETEETRSQVTPDTKKAEITQHNYAVVPNNNVPGTETRSTPRTDDPGSGANPRHVRNGRQLKEQSAEFPDEAKVHRRPRSGNVIYSDDSRVQQLRSDLEKATESLDSSKLMFATPQSHPGASPGLPVAASAIDVLHSTLSDLPRQA